MKLGIIIALFLLLILCFAHSIPGLVQKTNRPSPVPTQVPCHPTQILTQIPTEIQVTVSEDYTDTLKNVYAPPVQYRETEFRQIGYLSNHHRLPLFGRVLNRRDKWAYYTLEQGIKLPIEFNRRKCTQSPGCDSLSTGDEVLVEGVPYRVELYESFLSAY
jgi:hypothetical protein